MYNILPYNKMYRYRDEADTINMMIEYLKKYDIQSLSDSTDKHIDTYSDCIDKNLLNDLLNTYKLNTEEGQALMSLAEALIRTPDSLTQTTLIKDKLSYFKFKDMLLDGDIKQQISITGLTLSSAILQTDTIVGRLGWPIVRTVIKNFVMLMGRYFVLGQDMKSAIKNSKKYEKQGYTFSYDMLGESAITRNDAEAYFESYKDALSKTEHGISIKLSALNPRYEYLKLDNDDYDTMLERLMILKNMCLKKENASLIIDAEEADRLDLSMIVLEELMSLGTNRDGMIGVAVQAYQKRAFYVIDHIANIAKRYNTKIFVRLVKGAYWDTEIKLAQEQGLNYPVFTLKKNTDISYLACSHKLFEYKDEIYPAFATHNPSTVSTILSMATHDDYEFQRLFGMGEQLHTELLHSGKLSRIYAPVGTYQHLLAYLVRRMLENGANTSFVYNHTANNPYDLLQEKPTYNKNIPNWDELYGNRLNSKGWDLSDPGTLNTLHDRNNYVELKSYENVDADSIDRLYTLAYEDGFKTWKDTSFVDRKKAVLKFADLLEDNTPEICNLLSQEAGKTIHDGIGEIREAVDFCRYYVSQGEMLFHEKTNAGITGEANTSINKSRGVWLAISPWNFPVAIFIGQTIAPIVCGNSVITKPAEQTTNIAEYIVKLMYEAGIPDTVVQMATGIGSIVGKDLLSHKHLAGVSFTGSYNTGRVINQQLAEREGPIVPFIAETAGVNYMIVDSSALLEQATKDVVNSAFNSAGQRCSALRVLLVQDEIADNMIEMISGAIDCLSVGDTYHYSKDVGPIIDWKSTEILKNYKKELYDSATLINSCGVDHDKFVTPCAYEIDNLNDYTDEKFGPILHIMRYKKDDLDNLLDQINSTGYGLTFGIHSRIPSFIDYVTTQLNVGNIYVNRNQVGAIVESQPFGGVGLSGTGPKAGGDQYLHKFVYEQAISVNTTAWGGNTALMMGDS